jgi:hypothetical protein
MYQQKPEGFPVFYTHLIHELVEKLGTGSLQYVAPLHVGKITLMMTFLSAGN